MNRFSTLLFFVSGAFLFAGVSLHAAEVRSYNLILPDGSPISTTIVWKNSSGLDAISGNFHYAAGDLSFTGKNSAAGFIWMNDEHGTYYEFRKETVGDGFRWVGQDARGGRLALVPVGGKAPRPAAAPAGNRGTVRHYSYLVEGGGNAFPATIVWENIKGLGAISGTITYPGSVVSFSGRNPESGHITFTASDGAIYSLWRRQRGNSFEWAGTGADNAAPFQVTLVPLEKAPAGVPAPAPAAASGETVRQYTMTGPFGQRFPATLIWSNIKGLGSIKGSLFTPDANLAVNGQNSRSGFIYFTDENGTYYELTKQNPSGGKVRWTGSARFNDGSTRGVELLGN